MAPIRRVYQDEIRAYGAWYRELFAIAAEAGLRVFITTDIMFYTSELARYPGRDVHALVAWWQQALHHVFQAFPAITGVIMRFGEADTMDVRDTFRSALVLRTDRLCIRPAGMGTMVIVHGSRRAGHPQ